LLFHPSALISMKHDIPSRVDIACGVLGATLLVAIVVRALFVGIGN